MSDYQCPTFEWCINGSEQYPCCHGEHFWHASFLASMSAFKKGRSQTETTNVIVGCSYMPTHDVVPMVSITVGDNAQADMSLPEATVALEALHKAIEVARPFWDARPDVAAEWAEVW